MIALGEEPPEHEDCHRNYTSGSSKAMEATAALDLIVELHRETNVGIEAIVSDDDSTMRAHLHHIDTYKGGKLPLSVPQPIFLCDPSHRIKVMVKEIFALALSSKAKSDCEKIDALRLKKYLGCYVGKNKSLPWATFKAKSKAPVEHMFGTHEWCNSEWCYSKELDEARELIHSKATASAAAPSTTDTSVSVSLPPVAADAKLDEARELVPSKTTASAASAAATSHTDTSAAPSLPP